MESNNLFDTIYTDYLKERTIIYNDDVSENIFELVALPLLKMDKDGTNEPIELILNTLGGSVLDGLYLLDIIDNMKTPLTITIPGYACSMGFLIACSGFNNPGVTKRCYPFTVGMSHDGSLSVQGQQGTVRDYMEFNTRMEQKQKDYVLSHSNITEEDYDSWERKDKWFTSEQLLELGVVDYIIGK